MLDMVLVPSSNGTSLMHAFAVLCYK